MRSVNSPPSKTFELYVKTSPTTYVLHPLLTPFSFSTSSNPQKSGWKYGHYASSLLPNMSRLFFFFFLKGTDLPEKNLGAVFRHTPRSTWPWARIPLVVATRHWYVFKKRVGLALKQACTAVVGPTLQSFRTRLHRRIMLSQCGATVRSWCRGSAVTKWAP